MLDPHASSPASHTSVAVPPSAPRRARSSRVAATKIAARAMLSLVVAGGVTAVADASTGVTWTQQTAPGTNYQGVAYGNGTFVAVGPSAAMTSPDGVTWTARTPSASATWVDVAYGNGTFVAVAQNRVMTSLDGINWTNRTPAASLDWSRVAYGGGLFAVISSGGTSTSLMTSPDGITWTTRTVPTSSWSDIAYGNGKFVAVAQSGTDRAMTSPDGITWTGHAALSTWWRSVIYGNGTYVAVAINCVSNCVMTSPDGISWTARSAAANLDWSEVAHGDNQFVAVSYAGVSNSVMTSPDGFTWTSQTAATADAWAAVTYGAGLFVAAASGSANPIMTSGSLVAPPAPPATPTAVAGDGQATVTVGQGAGGGSPTGYTVTASPGGLQCTITGAAGSCTVTGLTNGIAYTFTATAENTSGISSVSATSAPVTPRGVDPQPTPVPDPVPAPTTPATPATPAATPSTCPSTFYQQAARTSRSARAPGGTAAVRVVSRIRIYQDAEAACRTDLTFIFRDARTKKRLAQLPGSTLGFRTLKGKDFSAPVISWPTAKEMRFSGGDTTGQDRTNARLVLVSYLKRVKGMPSQSNVELLIVRRIPANAAQPASGTNPLFAQRNAFGTGVSWAVVS